MTTEKSKTGWGGVRPNSGLPGRLPTGETYTKPQEARDYDKARARNEHAKAELNELDLKVKTSEFAPRTAFRQASATALAALSQTLRSIPDNIERKLGVSPEVAQEIGVLIDEALSDLASEFEMMTT